MIDLLALLKLQGSKCAFNQFCCACRGHLCEWYPGDAGQLLALCRKGNFGSWYHLKNANVQQMPSHKSLLGRTLVLQMQSAMCFGNFVFSSSLDTVKSLSPGNGSLQRTCPKLLSENYGLPYERFWSKKRKSEFLRRSVVGKCMDWCTR